MIDYDKGFKAGFIEGVNTRYLDLNTQVQGYRLVDLLRNPESAKNDKEIATYELAGSYAIDQTPAEPQEGWEPRPHLPPNSTEDSKPGLAQPPSNYPPYYQEDYLPPKSQTDLGPLLQALVDRQEAVLVRYEAVLQRLVLLIEDTAVRFDSLRLREELDWQQHLLEEKPKPYSPTLTPDYGPTIYMDSPPGSVSPSPRIGRDRSFLR